MTLITMVFILSRKRARDQTAFAPATSAAGQAAIQMDPRWEDEANDR